MRDKEFFLSRFVELEKLAKKVGGSAWQDFGGTTYVDMELLSEWRSQTLTLLRQVMPSSAPHTKQLEAFLEDGNKKVLFDRLHGIFKGAYQDFKVGRDQYKLDGLEWPWLTAAQWSTILRLLKNFFVYVTFYDPVTNGQKTLKMYPGDRSAEPYWIDGNGKPTYYRNCKFNLIDVGE